MTQTTPISNGDTIRDAIFDLLTGEGLSSEIATSVLEEFGVDIPEKERALGAQNGNLPNMERGTLIGEVRKFAVAWLDLNEPGHPCRSRLADERLFLGEMRGR